MTFINIFFFNFFFFFQRIRPDVSSESSARQRNHMKNQALCFLKDKSKQNLPQGQDSSPDSTLPIT